MANENDKIQKVPDASQTPSGIQKSGAGSIKITGKSRLHSALAQAGATTQSSDESFKKAVENVTASSVDKVNDPLTALNRIAIMADCSGSMSSAAGNGIRNSKIELLRQALTGFINQVNFDNTSVAIYTFPMWEHSEEYGDQFHDPNVPQTQGIKYRLSRDKTLLTFGAQSLNASGGTPMAQTMGHVIADIPLTRGIVISDGVADSSENALRQARLFAKSETIVDTVHIGDSSSGEKLLQQIAQITGGIYIKFDNVANFAKAFSFLTPEGRATLMLSGNIGTLEGKEAVARLLGAKEVK